MKPSKKILIFSIAYIPFVGGAELAVKEITDRLGGFSAQGGPAFGWDMITLRFDKKWPKFEKIGNVNVYRIRSPKLFFPFTAFFKALLLYRENKYDIAWSIMANRAGFAALFFKLFRPKIKFLLTLQEGDVLDYPQKRAGILWLAVKFLFKRIFMKADYIQVISNYLAVWARKMDFKGRLEIVPNGVDMDKFEIRNPKFETNFKPEIQNLKQKLDVKTDEKLIITTSRLVGKNAVGNIIEAVHYLPANIKLLILGVGPEEEKLKSQVSISKLQDRVIFLGHIEPREVPQYLAISDVFVRPSLSEGLGSSFLEAMAAGVPIVGTSVGGIPDFLTDPSTDSGQATGLFCEVKNPESIAEKVKILLENSELRQKIIANAKELVVKNYDWNLIAEKMRNIFNKLCR